jgi:hypothetical protein
MSPRDLVYIGHILDMAKKAVSKTQGSHEKRTTPTRTSRQAVKGSDEDPICRPALRRDRAC